MFNLVFISCAVLGVRRQREIEQDRFWEKRGYNDPVVRLWGATSLEKIQDEQVKLYQKSMCIMESMIGWEGQQQPNNHSLGGASGCNCCVTHCYEHLIY